MRRTAGAVAVSAFCATVLIGSTAAYANGDHAGRLTVSVVSNAHPDLVSGGDVLVRVAGAEGAPRLSVDGHRAAATPHRQADGSWLALVSGLSNGRHRIAASSGRRDGDVQVTNHSIDGPVFSGPRQLPFICQTEAFGLGAASQPTCAAATKVSYRYKNTAGAFLPLADPNTRPSDLATALVNGAPVPYLVRLEQGTIDRAVYEIAALYDGSDPTPFAPDTSWNRRLVYTFGGGCNGGFHQGTATGGVLNDLFLAQGYAVASSTLNVLNNNCSTIISAEAAMMVKEHFIERYGPVAHTIGWGGSGGAIQQYDIADQYPGILDGIVPGVSFPDPLTTIGPVTDCRLLNHFFGAAGNGFSAEQQRAISGFRTYSTCVSWDATFANRVTATDSCDPSIPVDLLWNPDTNPDGVKCSAAEQMVTQLGRDPRTGFARSPLDNIGVQYGLQALRDGVITAQQFVDVNAGVGGYDYTGRLVPLRSTADPRALFATYRDDLLNSGRQGLAETAVIDQRIDLDLAGFGNDIHTTEWSYVIRARMTEGGIAGNHVLIESDVSTAGPVSVYELAAMERWLSAIDADTSHRPRSAKVAADRPADVSDGCFLPGGTLVHEPLSYNGSGQCATAYPVAANTRLVAGQPLTMTALKCALKPLSFRDYPVAFTAAQRDKLRAAFPTGVCDYSRRGVGVVPPGGPWRSYGD